MLRLILYFVIICLYLWCWWLRVRSRGSGKIVRGCLPLIGHTLHITTSERLCNFVRDSAKETTENGGVMRIIIAMQTYYLITDPDDWLTASNSCLTKHFSYNFAKAWLGDGMITAPIPVWKRHRKLMNPAFTLQVLYGFLGIFNAQSRELVDQLDSEVEGERFDISTYFRKNALKTFSRTAFGVSGLGEESQFKKYAAAVDETLKLVVARFRKPWLQSDLIYRLSGLKRKEQKLVKVLNEMSDVVIKEKRATLNIMGTDNEMAQTSELKYRALLDLLLELSEDNTLTDKEIREELDTAIVAGFDTSSWLLTYICIMIGTHSHVQEKLYDELKSVFGDSNRDVYKEDLHKLVYTEAVIKETLRLYPIAPLSVRTVDADVQLKNHILRPGDHVFLSIYGINRHTVWGPDADLFMPERWLNRTTPLNAFAGFSIGKRSCLGKTFAMISMKTTLAHLLRRYQFDSDDTQLKLKMDFIMKPVSGHLVSFNKRKALPKCDRMRS